jgi:hypothetical protein
MRFMALVLLVAGCGAASNSSQSDAQCRADAIECYDACYGRYRSTIANSDSLQRYATCVRSCRDACRECSSEAASSVTCEPFSL